MPTMIFDNIPIDWQVRYDQKIVVGADEVVTVLGGEVRHVSRYLKSVKASYKFQWSQGKAGRPKWYLFEPGVYQLIFSSQLATIAPAKVQAFQEWVFEDVLPKLRTTGVAMTSKVTPVAIAKEWEAQGKELEELRTELTRLQEENFEQNKTIIHLSRERQKIALADLECAIANKDADRINTLRALSSLPPLSRLQAEAVKIGTYKM